MRRGDFAPCRSIMPTASASPVTSADADIKPLYGVPTRTEPQSVTRFCHPRHPPHFKCTTITAHQPLSCQVQGQRVIVEKAIRRCCIYQKRTVQNPDEAGGYFNSALVYKSNMMLQMPRQCVKKEHHEQEDPLHANSFSSSAMYADLAASGVADQRLCCCQGSSVLFQRALKAILSNRNSGSH